MSTTEQSELAKGLSNVMNGASIGHLQRLSGGASRETWRFEADKAPCVLQRVRPLRPGGLGAEVAVLTEAFRCGVPVPEVLVDGSHRDELDRPFMIVRAIEGETIARKILRDEQFVDARKNMAADLGRAAAQIHQVPLDNLSGLVAEDQLRSYRQVLLETKEPHPVFEIAFRWLEKHRPQSSSRCLVHGDFRLGNVLVDAHGVRGILDWELAHIGDPMEDLGWLCVRAWRFGGLAPVAGVGEYDALFDAYESVAGIRPQHEVVRWWEILGTLKWGIMCIIQAQTHLSGASRSHELAAIGRRVCENEYDLLGLLEEAMS